MKRPLTKLGDIFSVKLENNAKKYFQYVANDLSQLNSDVIRAFRTTYEINDTPDMVDIVKGEIQFFAHCAINLGVRMGLWEKVGTLPYVGKLDVVFRDTNDYGRATNEEPVRISRRWYVWRINEEFRQIGALDGQTRQASVGLVINPFGIIELLKGNKYPPNYPD